MREGGSKNRGAYLLTVYVYYGWPLICHGKFKKILISCLTLEYMYYIVDASNKEMFQLDSSLKHECIPEPTNTWSKLKIKNRKNKLSIYYGQVSAIHSEHKTQKKLQWVR